MCYLVVVGVLVATGLVRGRLVSVVWRLYIAARVLHSWRRWRLETSVLVRSWRSRLSLNLLEVAFQRRLARNLHHRAASRRK